MNTNKKVFLMSLPLFVELLLQLLVGNVDQIMVSRYSQDAVAAIVNGNQVMNLIIIVLNALVMATTVLLSKYMGAKSDENMSKICMLSISLISIICVGLTTIVLLGANGIFNAMNVPTEIFKETSKYLQIVVSFLIVQGLYLTFAAILRAKTYMKEVMYVSIVMNLLNIGGNAVLINGWFHMPRLGLVGAAISTVISKSIGLIIIIILFKKKVNIELGFRFLRPWPKHMMGNLSGLALPASIESLSYQVSQMFILGIINVFGTTVTATKGFVSIISAFSFIYAIAIAQAMQIVMGHLLGGKKTEEIAKRVWNTLKMALIVCEVMTLLLFINSDFIFGIFTSDPEVLALGKKILFIEFFLEIGRAMNICMNRALIAVGDAKITMTVGAAGHWLLAFSGAYLLGIVFDMGLVGVWIAMAIDECTRGFIYVIRFKKGKWKRLVEMKMGS